MSADADGLLHSQDGGLTWAFVPDDFRQERDPLGIGTFLRTKIF